MWGGDYYYYFLNFIGQYFQIISLLISGDTVVIKYKNTVKFSYYQKVSFYIQYKI